MSDSEKYISISEFNHKISLIIKKTEECNIIGEVSIKNQNKQSNHIWITLKDTEQNQNIDCVVWQNNIESNEYLQDIKSGDIVLVKGKLDYYTPTGSIKFIIKSIKAKDNEIGLFMKKKEELYNKYKEKGYFDSKEQLNNGNIKTIGLITAKDCDAMNDFIKTLKNRMFNGIILIKPALMQGNDSPNSIISAINYFNLENIVDVIVICRGGGSISDLSTYNDEQLIKTVYKSKIPVVCGIGHEKDVSLCDLASIYYASTPTAIACYLSNDNTLIKQKLENYKYTILNKHKLLISIENNKLETLKNQFRMKIKLVRNEYQDFYNMIIDKLNKTSNIVPTNIYINDEIILECKKFKKLDGRILECKFLDGTVSFKISDIEIKQNNIINEIKYLLNNLNEIENNNNYKTLNEIKNAYYNINSYIDDIKNIIGSINNFLTSNLISDEIEFETVDYHIEKCNRLLGIPNMNITLNHLNKINSNINVLNNYISNLMISYDKCKEMNITDIENLINEYSEIDLSNYKKIIGGINYNMKYNIESNVDFKYI